MATITGKKYGADDGSAGAPGFFFDAAGTTGMYHTGSAVALVDGTSVGLDVDGSWLNVYAFGARPQADDTQALGTSARRWTEVWAVDGTINTSDEREKMDIEDSALGLGFVRSLRPVSFRWRSTPDTQARESAEAAVDREAWAEHRAGYVARIREIRAAQLAGEVNDADGDEQVEAIRAELEAARAVAFAPIEQAHGKRRPGRRQHYGLIAQDVKAALDAAGVDAAFWKRGPDGAQSLAYSELIAPLIRAVQELAADNEALSGRVAALEADRA